MKLPKILYVVREKNGALNAQEKLLGFDELKKERVGMYVLQREIETTLSRKLEPEKKGR